jgi:hypothetical protein
VVGNVSYSSSLRTILKRLAGILVVEIVWFSLMAPLFPSNLAAFLTEAFAGICVFLIVYWSAKVINRLAAATRYPVLAKVGAAAIALSVGVIIFVVAYEFRLQLTDNFHYFLFAPH